MRPAVRALAQSDHRGLPRLDDHLWRIRRGIAVDQIGCRRTVPNEGVDIRGNPVGRVQLDVVPDIGLGSFGFGSGRTPWERDGARSLDARTGMFYIATGVTPEMFVKMVGVGSQYAVAALDADKNYLNGGKTYKLHLPPNVPVKTFWSVVVYDPQTRSELQTDSSFPSVGSQSAGIEKNTDGSYDVYFGPRWSGR
jgi:hypothetical protein